MLVEIIFTRPAPRGPHGRIPAAFGGFLSAVFLATSSLYAAVGQNQVGPRSDEEAAILLKDGKAAFDAGQYSDAEVSLGRLVARYPALPGTTEAQKMLGIAHLENGHAAQAVAPLRSYVETRGRTPEGLEGRTLLGRAYLETGKYDEAYLTAIELLNEKKKLSPSQHLSALLMKADAQMGLKRDKDAARTLESARKDVPSLGQLSPALRAETAMLGLKLKLRACSRLPSRGKLDEAQTRQQLQRRGDCLAEATGDVEEIFQTGDLKWSGKAGDRLRDAFAAYGEACHNPPNPPGKRSAHQLKKYREELVELLRKECAGKRAFAAVRLHAAEDRLSPEARSRIEPLIREIEAQ